MDIQILTNILGKPKTIEYIGVVVKPLPNSSYQVRDNSGKVMEVRAAATWKVGDPVTVLQGRIIGKANIEKQLKIYQV